MSNVTVPQLERVAYFDGQLITADDLTTAQSNEQAMRWLHNSTLHDWGIVTGLAVSGQRGDRAVTISPGMALDRKGREIILTSTLTMNTPVVAGKSSYYLVAIYQDDADQTVVETRSGVCANGGAVRLSDDPRIEWRTTDKISAGIDIVLALITISGCKLSAPVSNAPRRSAKPLHQPHIASGSTTVDDTVWKSWSQGTTRFGFTTHVDTSAGMFGSTPRYLPQIVGDHYLASSPGPLLAVSFCNMIDADRSGFTLEVALPAGPGGGIINPNVIREPAPGAAILRKLNWRVSWIGVED